MQVTVKFFASLRERMGRGEEQLQLESPTTVADLWVQLLATVKDNGPPLDEEAILAAVNHDYVDRDHALSDGDEVAFFPPVTGG